MRRWSWLLVVPVVALVAGCFGQDSYSRRLDYSLRKLEKAQVIKKNLMPAPTGEKKFQDLAIYIQPPRDQELAKTGQLPVGEGQFDLDSSFVDKAGPVLHLLARVKLPKKPAAKGQAAPQVSPNRGEFVRDVLDTLTSSFGPVEAFTAPKFASEQKGSNRFNRLVAAVNDKEVKIYTYKQDNHEVALVFVYDPKLKAALTKKIDLCLDTFAAGPKATRAYTGGAPEAEDPAAGPAVPL